MNPKRRIKTLVAAFVLCCFVSTSISCYGPFRLTQKLHAWNGTLGDKWINELVFFALVVIPAYGLCTLGDAIIFNSIQFWTGSNPIADGGIEPQLPRTQRLADGSLEVRKDGKVYRLRLDANTHAVTLAQDGLLVATAERTAAGGVAIHDLANGKTSLVSAADARTLSDWSGLIAALSPGE